MIKVLIVDDEPTARNFLHRLIIDFVPEISEVHIAKSSVEARKILLDFEPDIAFVDIEMPYQNGFEFLIKLKNPQFDVIFTTAHNRYAIQALRFSALDYLLKPIDPKELIAAMQRFLSRRSALPRKRKIYEHFVPHPERQDSKEFRLAVTSSKGAFFFPISEVLRIESDRNYSVIHLADRKKPFVATKTLKYYEDALRQFNFIRVHKSHLVNPEHVMSISNGADHLVLFDGTMIDISRRKREAVLKLLNVH